MLKQTKVTIKLKDLVAGYIDRSNSNGSVVGYNGKLDIRPSFQREFVYGEKERNSVIETVLGGYDLGKFTWGKTNDDSYELIDGQQRTTSICQFANSEFAINGFYYHNLGGTEKTQFDNYEIDVVICEGTDREKLEWFRRVNIAGKKLEEQELRNATYTSEWLECAKRYFSKRSCVATKLYGKENREPLLSGDCIRQDYLETVLTWASAREEMTIDEYMAKHSSVDKNADELIAYFEKVMAWVRKVFPLYRREMCGIAWGILYNKYAKEVYTKTELENIADAVEQLWNDEEVTSGKGIYEYVLSGCSEECKKLLNLRTFDEKQKKIMYSRQSGNCPYCGEHFNNISDFEAHHKIKWELGGKTDISNGEMVCKKCHKEKVH